MKVLLASNSNKSINKQIVDYVIKNIDSTISYIDLLKQDVPIYSSQLEEIGIPEYIKDIFEEIQNTDEDILIATPEYNGNTTPFYLNIFDWMSRIDKSVFANKNVKVLTVTPGKMAGQSVRTLMEGSLPYFGAKNITTYGVGNFYTVFKDGNITDENVKKELDNFIKGE